MIWPAETILILETYSNADAYKSDATPLVVDCIRKFTPESDYFPVHMFFAGDWCYQRFNATGEAKKMVGGASACHQCHSTAFHLTGDLVFTPFSEDTGGTAVHEPLTLHNLGDGHEIITFLHSLYVLYSNLCHAKDV